MQQPVQQVYQQPVEPPKMKKNTPQEQHNDLKRLLKERVADNQYNAYCVDCMRNQSTYFEMKHGVFICEACAGWHSQIFPYGKHYLKEIYTEHWDPYQLRVLSIASNEEWFKLL